MLVWSLQGAWLLLGHGECGERSRLCRMTSTALPWRPPSGAWDPSRLLAQQILSRAAAVVSYSSTEVGFCGGWRWDP